MREFQSMLYLFCDNYDQRLEDVCGLENINIIKLPNSSINDQCGELLTNMVNILYHQYRYLITVKYDPKLLTMMVMMGLNYRVFCVKSQKGLNKIKALWGLIDKLDALAESASNHFGDLEWVLNRSEALLTKYSFEELHFRNSDIVNSSDEFESIIQNGVWDVLVEDFGISL